MSRFMSLLAVQLRVAFRLSVIRAVIKNRDTRKMAVALVFGVFMAWSFGYVMYIFVSFFDGLYDAMLPIGQTEVVLTMGFLAAQVMVLFFSIMWILSALYFANDYHILIPMPFQPWQVLFSKFIVVYLYELLTAAFLLAPSLYVYGSRSAVGIWYWGAAVLAVLMTPVLPLLIASVIALIFMRFISRSRRRDTLAVLGGIMGLGVYVLIQYLNARYYGAGTAGLEKMLIEGGLVTLIGSRFPPSIWLTRALSQAGSMVGMTAMLKLAAASAVGVLLIALLAGRIYFRTITASQEVQAKKKRLSTAKFEAALSQQLSPLALMYRREHHLFKRNPVFFMNGIMPIIMLPVAMTVSVLAQQDLSFATLAANPRFQQWGFLVGGAALAALNLFNIISSSAITREGRNFWLSQVIPVPAKVQVAAKLLYAGTYTALAAVPIGIFEVKVLQVEPFKAVLGLLLGLLPAAVFLTVGLLVDLYKPNLKWTDPQKAMKGNFNIMVAYLTNMALLGVSIVFVVNRMSAKASVWPAVTLIEAAHAVLLAVLINLLLRVAENRYRSVD